MFSQAPPAQEEVSPEERPKLTQALRAWGQVQGLGGFRGLGVRTDLKVRRQFFRVRKSL